MIWFGGAHELKAADVDLLAVLNVLGIVLEGQQDATAAPAELVTSIWSVAVV